MKPRLRDLVLTGLLAGLTGCVTETIKPPRVVSIKSYSIGVSGDLKREIIEYKDKKIEIDIIRNNGNTHCLVYAPKTPDLIKFIYKNYNIKEKIFFITSEKTEGIEIN